MTCQVDRQVEMDAVVIAYRELTGEHIAKRYSVEDALCLVEHYGPIYALKLMTNHPVDTTMHALDRARADLRKRHPTWD